MPSERHLFATTYWLLRAAVVVNLLFIAALVVALAAVLLVPNQLGLPTEIEGIARADLLKLAVVGVFGVLVCAVLALFMLRTITAVMQSATIGDPFVRENAARLMRTGWLFLSVYMAELLTKLAIYLVAPESVRSKIDPVDTPPLGLLAVLLIFVLARIFRRGSEMRTELEGTV